VLENRDSLVSAAGRLGARFQAGERDFIIFIEFRPAAGCTQAFSPGIRRPKREADHSPASSAEVKNGGGIRVLSHTPS
jgi:hypothetical protein